MSFCLYFKMMDPCFISRIGRTLCQLQYVNNLEEMAVLLVLCSTVRLQGTHFKYIFEYLRSWMMWQAFTLLFQKPIASCQFTIQDLAEQWSILKFQLCASLLGYNGIQVLLLKQGPSKLVHMECWGVREHVCAVELLIRTGSVIDLAWILPWNELKWSPVSKCNPSMGKAVAQRWLCHM